MRQGLPCATQAPKSEVSKGSPASGEGAASADAMLGRPPGIMGSALHTSRSSMLCSACTAVHRCLAESHARGLHHRHALGSSLTSGPLLEGMRPVCGRPHAVQVSIAMEYIPNAHATAAGLRACRSACIGKHLEAEPNCRR